MPEEYSVPLPVPLNPSRAITLAPQPQTTLEDFLDRLRTISNSRQEGSSARKISSKGVACLAANRINSKGDSLVLQRRREEDYSARSQHNLVKVVDYSGQQIPSNRSPRRVVVYLGLMLHNKISLR